MSQLMQALQGIMQALGQGGGGGGGGSGSGGVSGSVPPGYTGAGGCMSYYQVNTPSSDPCAYYVPPATNYTNLPSGSLYDPNTGGYFVPTSSSTNNGATSSYYYLPPTLNYQVPNGTGGGDINSQGSPGANTYGSAVDTGSSSNIGFTANGDLNGVGNIIQAQLEGGARGNIEIGPNGETIYVNSENPNSNVGYSGFFGGGVSGSGGIMATLCRNRPWAGGFLSGVISPSFFDSLCLWRGYAVGQPPAASTTPTVNSVRTTSQSFTGNPQSFSSGQSGTNVSNAPQVNIWATPTQVPIGARTAIFWASTGAASCLATSPDGSFHETALSGGAATVPIEKETVYTITCTGPDGSQSTASVTVYLKS